ncbi:MAG TPA: ABC transporter substrate-binding protein [Actinomycetaceae bacterium]|nr:ABC transporter substrate-binding protein [Actinomycetaceae bacterium]
MSSSRKFKAGAGLTAVAALVLAACGTDNGGSTDGGGSDDGAERIYIEAVASDPTVLNPQFGGGPIPLRFGFAMMEPLVELNDQYEVSPVLAREWTFSDDGLTVTFELEEGVEWHDGEPFTAEDVAFNFEEIIELQSFGAQIANRIDTVETPDDHTVVLQLTDQYGPFLEALSQQVMVPKHVYEGTDYVTNPANMAPIGTGPMMFDNYAPGSEVTLVRNPNWWRGETEVDRVIYPIMTDANTRAMAMLNGELDNAVLDPSMQEDVSEHPDLMLTERGAFPQMIGLSFNARLPELEDPEVRALVFSAIDREAITRLALHGLGEPTQTFYPDALDWMQHPDINFDEEFPRDIEAINEGLDAAGWPVQDDGYRFTLDARFVSEHSEAASTAEVIQSSLADVHIGVNLVGATVQIWEEAVWGDYDFGFNVLRNTVGADPSIGTTVWLRCNPEDIRQNNPAGVCDEELHEAGLAAEAVIDREERAEHFRVVQERARDLIYWAPVSWYYGSFNTINTSRWEGLDDLSGQTQAVPWRSMTWVGD